jgi:hypothetical protein
MNINEYEYGCFYGKNYNLNKERFPDPNNDYDIILFLNLKDENVRVVSSIEGLFVYNKSLVDEKQDSGNLEKRFVIKRSEMKEFEKKYEGKFVPCVCGKK